MAKVPVYGPAPRESLAPLPGPRQNSVASPELFGSGARDQQEMGRALSTAGGALVDISIDMQKREDADSIFRAETALKDELIQFEQEAHKSRSGRFAKDLTTDTQKWWDERIKHHTGNLSSDTQIRMFSERALRLRQQSVYSTSKWEQKELEKSHDEGWGANKGATISAAAANATPENVDSARMEIDRLNRYQAARKGWEPERLKGENQKDLTTLHANVIQSIVRSDPIAAKAYFEKYKAEIDGSKHAEIGAFTEKVSANAIGEQSAGAVWEAMGPRSDRTPVELDKMEAELRKALKGNEPALDSAIRRLRDRANAFKDSRRERDEGTEAAVNRAIMGGASAAQVARMPEFNLLSPETGRKIIEHMDNRAAAVASRSASYSARADAEESRAQRRLTREGTDAALRLSDPEVIASMSRDQIVNLLPTLGAEHTSRLVAKKDAFEKSPEKLVAATIDKQLFDSIALEVGLHPNELKKSEDEKDQLVRLQDHIETVIDQEQRVKGKALSREEKATVMRRELDKKALVDGWFVNTEVPIPLLTPEQLSRTIVKVDGRDFKLSSIPERDLQGIAQEARRKGIRPTPQLIADKWFDLVAQRRSQGIE